MKHDFPKLSKGKLCQLFGKTRGAIYDQQKRLQAEGIGEDIILQHVHQIRLQLPRLGTRKLHYMLEPLLKEHNLQIGRDYLFELLDAHKLLIRQRKRKIVTTDSRHWMRKYANLVRELSVTRPEQLWVSDITYIRLHNQWGYLSLITDACSRMIMGYAFRLDMSVQGCIDALKMALDKRSYPLEELIHHSDRGSQYCSAAYTQILMDHSIAISMTENGDPYENALAERINGIIKNEFNLYESRASFEVTHQLIISSIDAYNEIRPHNSCNLLTPRQAHQHLNPLKKRWKTYPKKMSAVNSFTQTVNENSTLNYAQPSKKEPGTASLIEQVPGPFLRTINKTLTFEKTTDVQ